MLVACTRVIKTTLTEGSTAAILAALRTENEAFSRAFPGEPEGRQPVHTVYGGAHLFRSDMAAKLGAGAKRALTDYAPDPDALARALALPEALAGIIHDRVREKLDREPVEDFRIDFEDGFGSRPDAEEDTEAERTAKELARGVRARSLPPFFGIRMKSLAEETRERAVRTLDVFLTALAGDLRTVPDGFRITLPKVTVAAQVTAVVELLQHFERSLSLTPGSLRIELMMETTQALVDADGNVALPRIVRAARGRCAAVHFGSYDYTAGCDITAAHQSMTHPSCSFARHMMKVSLARTGVFLSDGATNVMPVPVHRARAGAALSPAQIAENQASVHAAWRHHCANIQDSLRRGFYQGWDLHPAQIPARYAAVYAFFLTGFDAAAERLSNFLARAAQASLLGDVFDDAATGQGLLNYFLRAISCGAIPEAEVIARTGLTMADLRTRSFAKILARRAAK